MTGILRKACGKKESQNERKTHYQEARIPHPCRMDSGYGRAYVGRGSGRLHLSGGNGRRLPDACPLKLGKQTSHFPRDCWIGERARS